MTEPHDLSDLVPADVRTELAAAVAALELHGPAVTKALRRLDRAHGWAASGGCASAMSAPRSGSTPRPCWLLGHLLQRALPAAVVTVAG